MAASGGRGRSRRLVAAVVVAGLAVLVGATPAGAHPLGNFTVNRYARVEVSAGVVRVHYVLDEAEIPAFQDRREVAADPEAFAAERARRIAAGLRLALGGEPVELVPVARRLSQPAGQGGLPTLRLAVTYEARLPAGVRPATRLEATFADDNEPGRIGWREVVVTARGDARLLRSDVPAQDVSGELRSYPEDRLAAPLDQRRATFAFQPGAVAVPAVPLTTAAVAPSRTGSGFAGLVDRADVSGPALLGLLALAFGFGALHALGPGHGKTVMAAYLVGTQGRRRDAFALGGAVSLMHTASVLVLALVLLRLDRAVAADRVYPWLTFASGLVVMALGAWLVVRRWRDRTPGRGHGHRHGHDGQVHELGGELGHGHHGDHDHVDHDHDHGHGHRDHADRGGHHHRPPAAPLSRRGLVALAASGGLFPSPTAVLVLLSAFSLHRAGLGLALVAAFSLGLAATLTAVGLILVYGRGLAERRGSRLLLPVLPFVGATALVVAGALLAARGAAAA